MPPDGADPTQMVADSAGNLSGSPMLFETEVGEVDSSVNSIPGILEPLRTEAIPLRPYKNDLLNKLDPEYNAKPLLERKIGLFQRTWASIVLDPHHTREDGDVKFTEFYKGIPVTTIDAMSGIPPASSESTSVLPVTKRCPPSDDDFGSVLRESVAKPSSPFDILSVAADEASYGGTVRRRHTGVLPNYLQQCSSNPSSMIEPSTSPFHGLSLSNYFLDDTGSSSPLLELPFPLSISSPTSPRIYDPFPGLEPRFPANNYTGIDDDIEEVGFVYPFDSFRARSASPHAEESEEPVDILMKVRKLSLQETSDMTSNTEPVDDTGLDISRTISLPSCGRTSHSPPLALDTITLQERAHPSLSANDDGECRGLQSSVDPRIISLDGMQFEHTFPIYEPPEVATVPYKRVTPTRSCKWQPATTPYPPANPKPKPKSKQQLNPKPQYTMKNGRYLCIESWCSATFTTKEDVKRHIVSVAIHRGHPWTLLYAGAGPCKHCARFFLRADSRKRHELTIACNKRRPSEKSRLAAAHYAARR